MIQTFNNRKLFIVTFMNIYIYHLQGKLYKILFKLMSKSKILYKVYI